MKQLLLRRGPAAAIIVSSLLIAWNYDGLVMVLAMACMLALAGRPFALIILIAAALQSVLWAPLFGAGEEPQNDFIMTVLMMTVVWVLVGITRVYRTQPGVWLFAAVAVFLLVAGQYFYGQVRIDLGRPEWDVLGRTIAILFGAIAVHALDFVAQRLEGSLSSGQEGGHE